MKQEKKTKQNNKENNLKMSKKEKINNVINSKWFHILLMVIGIIFVLVGVFHTEVWFDEAYTVSLINHNYSEIIAIDANDVHPVLYYLLLKTVTLVFGNSILVCRLFSVLAGILLGVLGYTHIRKDFGSKVGLAFTFLTFFLPFMAMYIAEIRMYTWTMLFVTLAGIYAYRIFKKYQIKNWILFAVFSLAAAHCHYYGLATVAILNGLLFLMIVFSKKMYENKQESKKKYLITFFIFAAVQIIGYIPWLIVFMQQAGKVSQGYWIGLNWEETVAAPLGIQFNGRLSISITVIYTTIMYAYLIYQIICLKKQKQNIGAICFCLLTHFILFFGMIAITVLIKPIMYHRYMLITGGIFILPFAYALAHNEKKHQQIISTIIVVLVLGLSLYNNSIVIQENYDSSNKQEIAYIREQYQQGDMILYGNIYWGPIVSVQAPELPYYHYHIDPDKNITPFENFSPPMKVIFEESELENYTGRIIIIDEGHTPFYNEIAEKYGLKEITSKKIRTAYRGYEYKIIVAEK